MCNRVLLDKLPADLIEESPWRGISPASSPPSRSMVTGGRRVTVCRARKLGARITIREAWCPLGAGSSPAVCGTPRGAKRTRSYLSELHGLHAQGVLQAISPFLQTM